MSSCAPAPDALALWGCLSPTQRAMLDAIRVGGDRFARPNLNRSLRVMEHLGLVACGERASAGMHRWSFTELGARVAAPPVVALDMDGVVARVHPDHEASAFVRLDGPALARLSRVVTATGARFLLSSTWREKQKPREAAERLTKVMRDKGFVGHLIDSTPMLGPGRRGEEIQAWLDVQPVPPRALAVLDDWEPMGHLTPRTVYTNGDLLLQDRDVDRVIALLSPPVEVLRFRCVECKKLTAGRLPRAGRHRGDGIAYFPRRHDGPDGRPCPGNTRDAEWVTVQPAAPAGAMR